MKTVNFYIHTLGGGGAEKALINMVNNLDSSKFNVKVTTILNTGKYVDSLNDTIKYDSVIRIPKILLKKFTNKTGTLNKEKKSGKAISLYTFFWKYFSWLLKPITWLQNRDSDIIVSYLEGPTHILVGQIPSKAPKVSWIHVDLSVEKKSEIFFRSLKCNRKSYSKFDRFVAVSDEVKDSLVDYMNVEAGLIDVLTNVYDEKEILNKANDLRVDLELEREIINFVSVGRLSHQKGYDRLIEAADLLVKENRNFVIRILGDGEKKCELEQMILDRKLEKTVILMGFMSNPYPIVKESDFFVASSRTEGYSTVVVESVIIRTPVLVTDCSGMRGILNKGNFGEIVENSTLGIYHGLKKIVSDQEYRISLQNKVNHAKDKYRKSSLVSSIENYLEELYV